MEERNFSSSMEFEWMSVGERDFQIRDLREGQTILVCEAPPELDDRITCGNDFGEDDSDGRYAYLIQVDFRR